MAPVRTIFRNLFARWNRSGTAAIEFALFLPLLVIILVGTADLGLYLIQVMRLNSAVEAGSLYVLKNGWVPATGGAPIITAMKTGAATGTASCFYGCASGALIAAQPGVCGSGSTTLTCPTTLQPPGQYVTLSASVVTSTLNMLSLPTTSTQTATVRWQ